MEKVKEWFSGFSGRFGETPSSLPDPVPDEEVPPMSPLTAAAPAPPPPPIRETLDRMRQSSPEELREDALQAYKYDPLPFLAAAFMLGFGLGRLILRMMDREERPHDDL